MFGVGHSDNCAIIFTIASSCLEIAVQGFLVLNQEGAMMKIKRISLYGGPGSGKTTLAGELFVHFKKTGVKVEYVCELAQKWALIERNITGCDQVYLLASQMHAEDTPLSRRKADLIVTDSPLFLSCFYTLISKNPQYCQPLLECAHNFEAQYPSMHFFCHPNPDYVFHQEGRFHSQEESRKMSTSMLHFIQNQTRNSLIELPQENRLEAVLKDLGD